MSTEAEGRPPSLVNLNDGEDRPKCRCPLAKGGVEHYRTDRCPASGRGNSCPKCGRPGDMVTAEGDVIVYACSWSDDPDWSVPVPASGRSLSSEPSAEVSGCRHDALDGAMHSVWLHGKWRWLTRNMTTEQKEAAWDAVKRYSAAMGDPDDEPLSEGWAWWRDDAPQDVYL